MERFIDDTVIVKECATTLNSIMWTSSPRIQIGIATGVVPLLEVRSLFGRLCCCTVLMLC
jgi:hypothetical protein